jgi:hypothetical protein
MGASSLRSAFGKEVISCQRNGIASQIVIVIADHHSHVDTSTGGLEPVENSLVRCDDVI